MMRDDPFSEISKLRDEEIQIAIWENPNCEIELNLVEVKKSKLRDGIKVDASIKSKLRDGTRVDQSKK